MWFIAQDYVQFKYIPFLFYDFFIKKSTKSSRKPRPFQENFPFIHTANRKSTAFFPFRLYNPRGGKRKRIDFPAAIVYNKRQKKTFQTDGIHRDEAFRLMRNFSMLVSAKEMLDKAKAGKYAVGHFNINNLEWTKAILLTAQENNSPVILGVSEGAGKYMGGYTTVVGMVNGMIKELGITVPVALHLDHGSYEAAKECIEKGFSSVMFDGSKYDIEENVAKTKEIVALAHAKGVSVEAEVGAIGGEEDGVLGGGEIADPDECASICELGVDMLAAGIGNIHGVYPENWPGLRLDVLAKIQEKTGTMPLVLHGGTGIPDEMVKDAISKGVSKINVNTECQIVFTEATRKYFEENKDQQPKGFDPRKVLKPGFEAIKAKVKEKMELFGSIDKA